MPIEKNTGVVNEVKSGDGQASYIGETLTSLITHTWDEHRRQSKRGGRFDTSAAVEYVTITGH